MITKLPKFNPKLLWSGETLKNITIGELKSYTLFLLEMRYGSISYTLLAIKDLISKQGEDTGNGYSWCVEFTPTSNEIIINSLNNTNFNYLSLTKVYGII